MDAMDWVQLAVQTGGAIAVCGMFLWYLKGQRAADELAREKKQEAEDLARQAFLDHLVEKDKMAAAAMEKQLEYMRGRDAQSKEIALSGHAALGDLTEKVAQLRIEIQASHNNK